MAGLPTLEAAKRWALGQDPNRVPDVDAVAHEIDAEHPAEATRRAVEACRRRSECEWPEGECHQRDSGCGLSFKREED